MRFELVLFLIAGLMIANVYTDGKILKTLFSWKKYYQMIGIAIGAYVIYWLFKRNPAHAQNIIRTSNDYLKYLPVDRNTASMLSPILDFTSKQDYTQNQYNGGGYNNPGGGYNNPVLSMTREQSGQQRMMNSGKKSTKRSVSETKKKFVAASQNWKCENCKKQLPAWFEVDHMVRLEHGGSNHIDNLVALCRDCHGEKTAIENL
jgi:5-methylcytosine-specific restriction endonuclease McrA